MIDTVKLAIPYDKKPEWLSTLKTKTNLDSSKGIFTTTIFPSMSYKQTEVYVPTLQFAETPSWIKGAERVNTLYLEASLPKLFFGNNFDELSDDMFKAVVLKLSTIIWTVFNIKLPPHELENAEAVRVDYSKNIIFTNKTPASSVISIVALGDISKTYDVQKTDFKNGGQTYHIHANIIDISMYDKIADLNQAKVSEKRSHENYNYTQLKLLDEFEKNKNISVPRFEIRLNTKRLIRKELRAIDVSDDLRFSHIFNTDISGKILLRHWGNITDTIPKKESLASTPSQILIFQASSKPGMQFAEASAHTLMQILRDEMKEERAVRNLIESLFTDSQYSRLKKMGVSPLTKLQLNSLTHVTETIAEMKPVNIAEFIQKL